MRKMHAVTEQVQMLDVSCQSLSAVIAKVEAQAALQHQVRAGVFGQASPEPHTLAAFEKRISKMIDEVAERFQRFEPVNAAALKKFKKTRSFSNVAKKFPTGSF